MNAKLNFNADFEWAHGPRWQQADLIRQDSVVFRWDEIDIRYKPTSESGTGIEWQTVSLSRPNPSSEAT